MVELGDRVEDKITGFQGIVTGVAEYISGCRQCAVTPEVTKDNKRDDGCWLDDDRLKILQKSAKTLKDRKRDGGPQDAPART